MEGRMELEKLIEVRAGAENLCPSNNFEPPGLGDDPRFRADCSTTVRPGEPVATSPWPSARSASNSAMVQP
jgi:hypothetical protein